MNANSEVGTLGTGNLVRLKEMNEFVLLIFVFPMTWSFNSLFSSKEDMQRYAITWVQLDWKEDCEGPNNHESIITNYWSEWLSMQRIVLVCVLSQSSLPEALLEQAAKLFWAHRNSFNPCFFLEQVPEIKYKITFGCKTYISYLNFTCVVVNLVTHPYWSKSLHCFSSSFCNVMHNNCVLWLIE